jgi:hypothetical protein
MHALLSADMAARGHPIDENAKTQSEASRLTGEAIEALGDERFRAILREAEDIVRHNIDVPKTDHEWLPWFLTVR